jgi:hypothetical protein
MYMLRTDWVDANIQNGAGSTTLTFVAEKEYKARNFGVLLNYTPRGSYNLERWLQIR